MWAGQTEGFILRLCPDKARHSLARPGCFQWGSFICRTAWCRAETLCLLSSNLTKPGPGSISHTPHHRHADWHCFSCKNHLLIWMGRSIEQRHKIVSKSFPSHYGKRLPSYRFTFIQTGRSFLTQHSLGLIRRLDQFQWWHKSLSFKENTALVRWDPVAPISPLTPPHPYRPSLRQTPRAGTKTNLGVCDYTHCQWSWRTGTERLKLKSERAASAVEISFPVCLSVTVPQIINGYSAGQG